MASYNYVLRVSRLLRMFAGVRASCAAMIIDFVSIISLTRWFIILKISLFDLKDVKTDIA